MNDSTFAAEMTAWRHQLHEIPETGFNEYMTSDFVADRLAALGVEVTRGVGGTGVVGTLRRGDGTRSIGLRAEMDALAIEEAGTCSYSSKHRGRMHACGHDGHMAILLGAAKLLSQSSEWQGTVRFVFQPNEEHGKGAKAMLDDGLLSRFPMEELYGLHNTPGLPEGQFATRAGAIMASEDNFIIEIRGRGAHAARPHMGVDPIVIGAEMILALQTIVSRNLDPSDQAVVSITEVLTNGARNVIPGILTLKGDTRSFLPRVQSLLEARMGELVRGFCLAYGAEGHFSYSREFEPTLNTPGCLPDVLAVGADVAGPEQVDGDCQPMMSSEDFGAMLHLIPGNYMFLGSGLESLPLHNPSFDFNDRLLVPGARYLAALAQRRCNSPSLPG